MQRLPYYFLPFRPGWTFLCAENAQQCIFHKDKKNALHCALFSLRKVRHGLNCLCTFELCTCARCFWTVLSRINQKHFKSRLQSKSLFFSVGDSFLAELLFVITNIISLLLSQTAHYDKCVINLRERHKPDMSPVLEYIFSHAQVSKKNVLVTMLIVRRSSAWTQSCINRTIPPNTWVKSQTLCALCRISCVEEIQR